MKRLIQPRSAVSVRGLRWRTFAAARTRSSRRGGGRLSGPTDSGVDRGSDPGGGARCGGRRSA